LCLLFKPASQRQPVKQLFKQIGSRTLRPLVQNYLSKERWYSYNDLRLLIAPQVFHPGFFFSTRLLLNYILKLDLKKRSFLELGAGSGLIAMSAAKKGAIVTATDINTVAIDYLQQNVERNSVSITILRSDLFDDIPLTQFDVVAINPPYYKRNPQNELEHAWFCGEQGEYFVKLFSQLGNYIHSSTGIIMVLCDDCDVQMIESIANRAGYKMQLQQATRRLWEMNYIYEIKQA
jgi:release factor glutamine methyltransferase